MMKIKVTKNNKSDFITYAMVLITFVIVLIWQMTGTMSSHLEGLLVPVCVYVVLAVSLNLTVGILGELSLGHAGFMCIGAFAGAFFSKCMVNVITIGWLRFLIAMIIGAFLAGLLGFFIGIPVLRLKGDYLAIVTLGFGEIIKNLVRLVYIGLDENGFHISTTNELALNMSESGEVIIKGAQGILNTPKDASFIAGTILIVITLIVVLNLKNSRAGRAIMAIRDNRIAVESLGVNVTKYKLIAFTVSSMLAGAAGVLYSHNLSSVTARTDNFGYTMSILILVFVVLGGIGNIRGSIISAVILTLLPELLRSLRDYRMLIYSIVLIAMMLYNWAPSAIRFRERMKYTFRTKFAKKENNDIKGGA